MRVIIYLACALACIGISVYYFCVSNVTAGIIYLAVGIACAVPSLYSWLRGWRHRDDDDK